ncbi:MAG: hypothetical protein GXX85_04050 [Ignavibacteria bacterium]|nr:hypothetical protein [Ignavibacteria bacterium]
MIYNPLFLDTGNAGNFLGSKSLKLSNSGYLFSDIIKVEMDEAANVLTGGTNKKDGELKLLADLLIDDSVKQNMEMNKLISLLPENIQDSIYEIEAGDSDSISFTLNETDLNDLVKKILNLSGKDISKKNKVTDLDLLEIEDVLNSKTTVVASLANQNGTLQFNITKEDPDFFNSANQKPEVVLDNKYNIKLIYFPQNSLAEGKPGTELNQILNSNENIAEGTDLSDELRISIFKASENEVPQSLSQKFSNLKNENHFSNLFADAGEKTEISKNNYTSFSNQIKTILSENQSSQTDLGKNVISGMQDSDNNKTIALKNISQTGSHTENVKPEIKETILNELSKKSVISDTVAAEKQNVLPNGNKTEKANTSVREFTSINTEIKNNIIEKISLTQSEAQNVKILFSAEKTTEPFGVKIIKNYSGEGLKAETSPAIKNSSNIFKEAVQNSGKNTVAGNPEKVSPEIKKSLEAGEIKQPVSEEKVVSQNKLNDAKSLKTVASQFLQTEKPNVNNAVTSGKTETPEAENRVIKNIINDSASDKAKPVNPNIPEKKATSVTEIKIAPGGEILAEESEIKDNLQTEKSLKQTDADVKISNPKAVITDAADNSLKTGGKSETLAADKEIVNKNKPEQQNNINEVKTANENSGKTESNENNLPGINKQAGKPVNDSEQVNFNSSVKDAAKENKTEAQKESKVSVSDINAKVKHDDKPENNGTSENNSSKSSYQRQEIKVGENQPKVEYSKFNEELNRVNNEATRTKTEQSLQEKMIHKFVKSGEVMQEISKFVQKGEKNTLIMQIEPKNLGQLKITIDHSEQVMKAFIEVENPAVKQAVESKMQELVNNLSQNGLNLGAINVSLSQNDQKLARNLDGKKKHSSETNKEIDTEIKEENPKERIREMGYNTYEFLA